MLDSVLKALLGRQDHNAHIIISYHSLKHKTSHIYFPSGFSYSNETLQLWLMRIWYLYTDFLHGKQLS